MKRGCVTIILPSYNSGEKIERAINSVISQSYKNWELIIINDASTDNTSNYVTKFKDKRITIKNNKKNLGIAMTRNNGLKIVRGEYIAFLDADDWLDRDFIQKGIMSLETNKTDVVVFDIQCVRKHSKQIVKCNASPFSSYPSVWNKLYRAKLWENEFFDKNRYIEDFPIVPIIMLKAHGISKVKDSYYHYRQVQDSTVHSWTDPYKQLRIIDDVKSLFSRLTPKQITKYNSSLKKFINYQLSEHFWKGVEDAKDERQLESLFVNIAFYSKKLNETEFNNYNYFYPDTVYHRLRNSMILPFFSIGMYKQAKKLYMLLLKMKSLIKKLKKYL